MLPSNAVGFSRKMASLSRFKSDSDLAPTRQATPRKVAFAPTLMWEVLRVLALTTGTGAGAASAAVVTALGASLAEAEEASAAGVAAGAIVAAGIGPVVIVTTGAGRRAWVAGTGRA